MSCSGANAVVLLVITMSCSYILATAYVVPLVTANVLDEHTSHDFFQAHTTHDHTWFFSMEMLVCNGGNGSTWLWRLFRGRRGGKPLHKDAYKRRLSVRFLEIMRDWGRRRLWRVDAKRLLRNQTGPHSKTTNGSNCQVVVCGLGLVSLMVPVAEMHGRLHGGQLVSGLVRAVIITEGRSVRNACRPIREERVVIHNVQCVWVRKEEGSFAETTILGDALDGVFGQYRGVRLGRVDVLDYRTWLCLWWHPKIHCGCSR